MEIKLLDLMVSLGVFQTCWPIIKTNLLEVFQYFFENAQFDKSLNATFISLIPKKFDVGVFMVVVYGEVSEKVGTFLASISGLR